MTADRPGQFAVRRGRPAPRGRLCLAEDEARLLIAAARTRLNWPPWTAAAAGEPLEHVLGWAEFAGCGSPWTRACSSRGAAPSS